MEGAEVKHVVEIYYDSRAQFGMQQGGYRARLATHHGHHDAGRTAYQAFQTFLRLANSRKLPDDPAEYRIELLPDR